MRGFSLVEVVIVSALLLLGSLVAFQTAEIVSLRDKEERLRYSLLEMRSAIDQFFGDSYQNPSIPELEKPRFPKTIEELLTTKRPVPGGTFYLRRLPLNPMLSEVQWELRGRKKGASLEEKINIASIADKFEDPDMTISDIRYPEGVYPDTGLNGVLYHEW